MMARRVGRSWLFVVVMQPYATGATCVPPQRDDAPARICQTGIDTHDNLRFHLHSFDTNKCSRIEYPFGPRHAANARQAEYFNSVALSVLV